MRRTIKFATGVAAFAFLVAGTTTITIAHKGATGIVMERMMAMKDIGKGMKSIGLMLRGKQPFNAVEVKSSAAVIKKHANDFERLFPKGSIKGPSEATDKIWADWDGFNAIAKELAGYAGKLEGADGTDPAKIKPVFAKMASTCKGCHQDYRKKKE